MDMLRYIEFALPAKIMQIRQEKSSILEAKGCFRRIAEDNLQQMFSDTDRRPSVSRSGGFDVSTTIREFVSVHTTDALHDRTKLTICSCFSNYLLCLGVS